MLSLSFSIPAVAQRASTNSPLWARYSFTTGVLPEGVTFARATTGTYRNSSGALQIAAVDEPRFDHTATGVMRGLLVEAAATSKLTVRNANPTVVSDIVSSAWAGVALSIVTDAAELAAAKLSGVVGTVLKIEADGSAASAAVSLAGVTGTTSPHVFSAHVRVVSGQISLRGAGTGTTYVKTDISPGGYGRHDVQLQPGNTSAFCRIYTETATTLAFVTLPNMTESTLRSSEIVQTGSATTRAADIPRITNLPVGSYDLRVVADGASTILPGVAISGPYWPAAATGRVETIEVYREGALQ